MHRRIRQATMAAVMVAVVLLGVPLAIFGVSLINQTEERLLTSRAENLARAVDRRLTTGQSVDSQFLERNSRNSTDDQNSQDQLPAYIVVITNDGKEIRAGTFIDGETIDVAVPSTKALVQMSVSATAVAWRSAQAVFLVLAASMVAFAGAMLVASRQARRITAPLIYLAASAEQLGSGQVRPRLEPSGIEEIDLVAAELARSADRMAGRLAAERQFTSDASHQLRTPLTALSMRLEEIQALSTDEAISEEARISLEQIERLVTTVEELLGRSRRAGVASTAEAIHLHEITSQQLEEWEPAYEAAARTLAVDVPEDLTVLGTPGALAQVLATLLENSLKYGAGTTRLQARSSGRKGGVVIEVSDEGPGVSDEIAPRIFERNVTSGRGTGLGLALARDLVAADGGRLELAQRRPPIFAVFLSGLPRSLDPDLVVPQGAVVDPLLARRRRGR